MPDGEACNVDGTLKEASKIVWLHSPSNSSAISRSKRAHNDSGKDQSDEITLKKKTCVLAPKKGKHEQSIPETKIMLTVMTSLPLAVSPKGKTVIPTEFQSELQNWLISRSLAWLVCLGDLLEFNV